MLTILGILAEPVLHRSPDGLGHEEWNQQLKDNSELRRKGKRTSQEGLAQVRNKFPEVTQAGA